jgi:hypothetical protein
MPAGTVAPGRDLVSRLDPGDAEVVDGFINDLTADASEIGGADVLSLLQIDCRNSIRITDPIPVQTQTLKVQWKIWQYDTISLGISTLG